MTIENVRKCRLCGYSGLDVSPAIYRQKNGRFALIAKCDDHAACEKRRPSKEEVA